MIRQFQKSDTERVMQIWLHGNEEAHDFIPKEYWRCNYEQVSEQISEAEVSVCESNGEIQGFLGIMDGYIAGIFVDCRYRSRGIGRQLLEYAKQRHDTLTLNVYQRNKRAVSFYLREGFSIQSQGIDGNTGETEYMMLWRKNSNESKPYRTKTPSAFMVLAG